MSEFDNLIKKRAVALKYDSKNNRAPIIVASGMGYLAERITEAAAEAGVPVYEDDSLVRRWVIITVINKSIRENTDKKT